MPLSSAPSLTVVPDDPSQGFDVTWDNFPKLWRPWCFHSSSSLSTYPSLPASAHRWPLSSLAPHTLGQESDLYRPGDNPSADSGHDRGGTPVPQQSGPLLRWGDDLQVLCSHHDDPPSFACLHQLLNTDRSLLLSATSPCSALEPAAPRF